MQRGQNIRGSTVRLILAGDPDDHEFTVLRTVVLERVGFVHRPFPQKGVLETVLGGMGRRSGE
jgi:hypothetical protein